MRKARAPEGPSVETPPFSRIDCTPSHCCPMTRLRGPCQASFKMSRLRGPSRRCRQTNLGHKLARSTIARNPDCVETGQTNLIGAPKRVYSVDREDFPDQMRQLVTCTLLLAGIVSAGLAQCKDPSPWPASPPRKTSVTINGKSIWVGYHAPSVKGRKIFGGPDALQPDNSVWRLGAQDATCIHTDAELDFNGLKVPPGDYSLYIDLDAGKWKLILNKQTGQWGINRDGSTTRNAAQDVGAIALAMSKSPALVEQLKIDLTGTGGNKGRLQIQWENVSASTTFTAR